MAAISFSVGAPFAPACGAARVVTGVSLVSAADELARPAGVRVTAPTSASYLERGGAWVEVALAAPDLDGSLRSWVAGLV